jgi:hypothetical protein
VSHSLPPLEFFVDRSLGRHRVAQALRNSGWALRTHHEVYSDRDEQVPDVEWLELCGREGWPVLTKDRSLRYRPAEIAVLRRFGVRAFVVTGGSLTAIEQAARFDRSPRGSRRRARPPVRSCTRCTLTELCASSRDLGRLVPSSLGLTIRRFSSALVVVGDDRCGALAQPRRSSWPERASEARTGWWSG